MAAHRYIDRICLAGVLFSLVLSLLFMNGQVLGIQPASRVMGYEGRLFDTSRVHTIDIVMDDWISFIDTCENEEYASCAVVIDNESYKNVGIRAKGNTSLSTVSRLDSDRYSFKIEFDHYDSGKTYYGLDKLSLNNVIQDNTYMKDYLTYRMMGAFGACAPLCSYVYITVNGQDWGLYLAVEGVEDAFLQRNYGQNHGELYKPDSMSFGGNMGGRDGMGSTDVKLQYAGDDPDSYASIFDSAKTDVAEADQARLIWSLKALSEGGDVSEAVDIDQVLRYFVVHNFVVNGDSYTGSMVHNYYLYEEDGRLSMLPWDYNLAFGTFQGGNASSAVNDPIDTPRRAWRRGISAAVSPAAPGASREAQSQVRASPKPGPACFCWFSPFWSCWRDWPWPSNSNANTQKEGGPPVRPPAFLRAACTWPPRPPCPRCRRWTTPPPG